MENMESRSIGNVSIDRITIIAKKSLFLSPFGQFFSMPGLVYDGNGIYRVEAKLNDNMTQNLAYISYYCYSIHNEGIRVDFNPNNSFSENNQYELPKKYWKTVMSIVNSLYGDIHLSRCDIAFDIFDNRMSNYRYVKPGCKTVYLSRNGDLETIYYGSFKSDKQIRQYNKQVERISKGVKIDYPWWRLELQLRTKYIDRAHNEIAGLLSNFKPVDWSFIDNVQDIAIMHLITDNPEYLGRLSHRQKVKVNKYRKMSINSSDNLVDDLIKIYDTKKADLNNQLAGYLQDYKINF